MMNGLTVRFMAGFSGQLFAHTPRDGSTEWHDLRAHLLAVSSMCKQFGEKLSAPGLCAMLGLCHDLAKADERFQKYLVSAHTGKRTEKCPHAAPSGVAVQDDLQLAIMAILGHHRGLYDVAEARSAMARADQRSIAAASQLYEELKQYAERVERPELQPLECEVFLRMVFSALVDADYLDTERHFSPDQSDQRGSEQSIPHLADCLRSHMDGFPRGVNTVSSVRADVLESCRGAASRPRGAFRLTVPTGGGKTLASLSFALEHAKYHGHDRVIVAIPYTSIIDQTADVYRGVFDGNSSVLEHHSTVEIDEDADEIEQKRKLGAENWDAAIVVTTTVQLFESLFANKPAPCRKLHNIANSVIVLDEVQTLPPHLLEPILDVLATLMRRFGCSVVFCTATQPSFEGLKGKLSQDSYAVLSQVSEIVCNASRHFEALRRVRFELEEEPLAPNDIAELLATEDQVLCVLNTRKDAVSVLRACQDLPNLWHLSTLMCPHHRKHVLATVRKRLKEGLPVRLVSTQVVEAGVDVDFPVVMRDLGPLDRIVQVAGRCNREGRLPEPGKCKVFELLDGAKPKGSYLTGCALAKTFLSQYPHEFDTPRVMSEYFRRFYENTSTDGREVQKARGVLNYETVGRRFKMIDSETVPLFVENYSPNENLDELEEFLDSFERGIVKRWYQKAQSYSVSVYQYEAERYRRNGLVSDHPSGLFVYGGAYSDLFGIGSGDELSPGDLIV